jgi:hypothetical protein
MITNSENFVIFHPLYGPVVFLDLNNQWSVLSDWSRVGWGISNDTHSSQEIDTALFDEEKDQKRNKKNMCKTSCFRKLVIDYKSQLTNTLKLDHPHHI